MSGRGQLESAIRPGVLLSETHVHFCGVRGAIADAVSQIAEGGFYEIVEIPDIPDGSDRKRIGDIARESGLELTYWASRVLNAEGLDLSSLDEDLRRRSVCRLKELLVDARECGASRLGVLSGKDGGAEQRPRAIDQLCRSLCELSKAAGNHFLRIELEPLDRGAHKNGVIGPTAEAVDVVTRVRHEYANIGLSWDTAHSALCGEDPITSLTEFSKYIDHVHLANAVLDRSHPFYGDHHMPIGVPGFLCVDAVAALFAAGLGTGFFGSARPGVSVEMRTARGCDPWETERLGRSVLEEAWEMCMGKKP